MPVRVFRNDVVLVTDAGPECSAWQPKIDRGNERKIWLGANRRSKTQSPRNGLASAYEAIGVLNSVVSL
jgi:hypothetical protein